MPHGQPDYGMYAAKETTGSMADNAELAARLGSIVTHDRRGDVIWLDGFEGGLNKWEVEWDVATAKADQCPDWARNGGFSCKLQTAADKDAYVRIVRDMPYPVLSKIGIEFSFSLEQYVREIRLDPIVWDGTHGHLASILWVAADKQLQYRGSDMLWHPLPGVYDLEVLPHFFHTLKLVVNYPELKYERLILDNHIIDLSTLSYNLFGLAWPPELEITAYLWTNADEIAIAYFDDFIITQNEP